MVLITAMKIFTELLVLVLMSRRVVGEIFAKTCRGCQNFDYFLSFETESLIHCAMLCNTRYQCQSMTYEEQHMICKLHSLHTVRCNDSPISELITLQKQRPVVSECNFPTTTRGSRISVNDRCGNNLITAPLIFKMKGGNNNQIFLHNGTLNNRFRIFIQDLAHHVSYDFVTISVYPGTATRTEANVAVLNPGEWAKLWIMFYRKADGNTTVTLGRGDMAGCEFILEMCAPASFDITHVELHTYGTQTPDVNLTKWIFYNY